MQEIELQQGFFTQKVDGRGIERLRFLAMQFEGMGKIKTADANVSPPGHHQRKAGSFRMTAEEQRHWESPTRFRVRHMYGRTE